MIYDSTFNMYFGDRNEGVGKECFKCEAMIEKHQEWDFEIDERDCLYHHSICEENNE